MTEDKIRRVYWHLYSHNMAWCLVDGYVVDREHCEEYLWPSPERVRYDRDLRLRIMNGQVGRGLT